MQMLKKLTLGALAVGALLVAAGGASAQPIANKEYDKIMKATIDVAGCGGQYRTNSYRYWDKWRHKDVETSRSTNNLHVWLGNSGTYTVYQAVAEGTATRLPASRPVSINGYVRFRGNTVEEVPLTSGIGDIGFDKAPNLGSTTFFSASVPTPVPFVTLSVSVRGFLGSQITSWSHTSANPNAAGESDFSLTGAKVTAGIIARGSVSAAGIVGVYGELTVIQGSLGPNSSTSRFNFPMPEGGESTRFDTAASTAATISMFAGEIGIETFIEDIEVVDWDAPITATTQLYTPQKTTDWAHESATL